MNPDLISALLNAGLLDADTADILRRQTDPEAARAWAEQQIMQGVQGGLTAQQSRLLDLVQQTEFSPTEQELTRFWRGEDDLLWQAMRPNILQVVSERAALSVTNVNVFHLVNQNVIRWAEEYYINPDAGVFGSIPNLNLTSRAEFARAFIAWQRGEMAFSTKPGLPGLIDALTPVFGPVRAEAIAVTETTRLFIEAQRQAESSNPFTVAFRWQSSADEMVCPICGPMHGQVRRKNEGYPGGVDIPAHPRCRCHEAIETEATLRQPLAPEERFVFSG